MSRDEEMRHSKINCKLKQVKKEGKKKVLIHITCLGYTVKVGKEMVRLKYATEKGSARVNQSRGAAKAKNGTITPVRCMSAKGSEV